MTFHKRLGAPVAALFLSAMPLTETEAQSSGGSGISCPPGWTCDTNTGKMRRITEGAPTANAAPTNRNATPRPRNAARHPVPRTEKEQVAPRGAAGTQSGFTSNEGDIACPPGWMCNTNTGQMRRMGDGGTNPNAPSSVGGVERRANESKYEYWRRIRKERREHRGGGGDDD